LDAFPGENRKADNTSSGRFSYNRSVSQFGWNGGFHYTKLRWTSF
jgi:hypothetical protein